MLTIALTAAYGLFAVVALCNLALMRRPPERGDEKDVAICIPARDEEANLCRLLPELKRQGARVYVFDDESSDGTARVANECGAIVISGLRPLPEGWTGKNRACHELAKAVSEDFPGDWMLFLDADVYPLPGFVASIRRMAARYGRRTPVITGIPAMLSAGVSDGAYMFWVAWVLLAAKPFFLASRAGVGHSRFTNGQITLWRAAIYWEVNPNETVRASLLEDVKIGRLLAQQKIRTDVALLRGVLRVRMYESLRQAISGMTKNSGEIAGSPLASAGYVLLLTIVALAWIAPIFASPADPGSLLPAACLAASALFVNCMIVPDWKPPRLLQALVNTALLPISLLAAATTVARSSYLRRHGKRTWKGREYSG